MAGGRLGKVIFGVTLGILLFILLGFNLYHDWIMVRAITLVSITVVFGWAMFLVGLNLGMRLRFSGLLEP